MPVTVISRLHDTTCCETGWTTGCIVYTSIQPVVQPSSYNQEPVEQLAASCKQTSNRLYGTV